ncbi:MAG: RNA-binding S4 domain-containing protein [Crocinitomicaceae bacterium]|jgi:ribosome-associated protein|nr:RNA-binding S4 domain-containing protein [Crocinitomicaceae bacterium]MDC0098945.1 RNA-binding S4 domain-containing protein [Crocinitomicaceae bacterium]|tara:strand:- start:24686 stop:24895 length:210 start_codon:yes stop_codon:yes gene_type:complete
MQEKFKIEGPYIELIQLLKVQGIAQTGGHAKLIVEEGVVYRNGEIEMRKRAKLIPGDQIKIDDSVIDLI